MDVPNKTHHRSKTGSDPLALETNLQLLPLIMDNIPQAVFWKDRDLIYLGCNQAFAEDAGLDSPEQIIGKTDYDMPWTDQAELYRSDDAQVLESGEAKVNFEEPQTSPSGEITWLRTSKIPVRDESGEVVAVLGMYEDITETKQAEQAMRGNENRLRAVYEGTNDAVMLLTPDGFFDCNPRTLELFGFDSVEEFTKVHPADISPPYQPDGKESFPAAQKCIMTAYEKGYYRFDWVHRRKNGEDFPAEVLLSAFEIDDETVLQATVRDISERKKVENALQQSEQLLNGFINNFPDGVWAKDTEGRFILANRYIIKEIAGTEVIGKTVYDTMPKENADFVWASEKRLLETGEPVAVEEDVPHADGKIYKKLTTKFPIYDVEGNINGIGGILFDITERKQTEKILLESEARFRTLFEQSADAYLIIDEGRFVDCNQATVTMLRATDKQAVLDTHPSELSPEFQPDGKPSGPKADEMIQKALDEGSNRFEWTHRRMDGVDFPVEVLLTPITTENKTIIHTIWRDITNRKRLEAQTQEALEKRGYQVQISTEISQEIAEVTELSELFNRVVELTKERLGYYHTQLLRYEPMQDAVVLISGYGEIGQQMAAQGHHMPMGSGLIGTAAATGETVMRPDLAQDPDWQPNPLLPETRGEIAVPIKLGDVILGVLDVQSDTPNALAEDDRLLLEGLCGQIAIAIEQTRLRQEMTERLDEINQLYRSLSREGWESFTSATKLPEGFQFDQSGIRAIEDEADSLNFFSAPLTVPGGLAIGTLAIGDDPQKPLSPEDQALLEQVSEQVALALESARLFEQTQVSLAETQSLYHFNEVISSQSALENIYQEVAQMVCKEVGFSGSWIAIHNPESQTLQGVTGVNMPEDLIKQSLSLDEITPGTLAAQMRQTVIVNDPQKDERMADIPSDLLTRMGKAIALPIMAGQELIGVIAATRESGSDVGDREERILQIVADQLSIAIERTRLFEQTQSALEAVQESQEQLSEALEIAKLGYWEYDFANDEFILTDNFYAIFHTNAEAMGGYRLSSKDYSEKFVHPEDSDMVGEEIGRAIAATDPNFTTQVEHRILYQDGGVGYISVNINLEKDDEGNILRWWGANQDITERWLAFNAVRESEEQLGEALEIAKLGNFEYDVENDIFTFNDHFYAIFHTTAEEVGGYQMASADYAQKFVYPDDMEIVGVEIGKALSSTERHYNAQIEHRILYADGGIGHISVNLHVERDEDGKITRYYGANQDITERKLADEAVRQAQERAQTILETVTIPMVITRLSDNILTFANDPAAEIVGLPMDELVNSPAPNFYHNAEEREQFVSLLQEQGFVNNLQVQLVRGDGSTFYALLSSRIFVYQGDQSILTTITDISERIAAQEVTAKRAAELATVAELGTAISTVLEERPLIETVVQQTRERFDLYHCHIFLADENSQTLQVMACGWEEDSPHAGTVEPVLIHADQEQSLVAQAARDQQAVIVNDVQADPNWLPNEQLPDTRSEMAIPMVAGNQVLGVLDVQANEVNRFDEEDISIMTTLASQVAVALQNVRTYAKTQQQAEHEAMINLISQRIQSTTSVENALQVAIRELGRALGAKRTNVQLGLSQQQKSDK